MKTFEFIYHGTARCKVSVDAESKEEAQKLADEAKENGEVYNEEWNYDQGCYLERTWEFEK